MGNFERAEREYYSDHTREQLARGIHEPDNIECSCADCEEVVREAWEALYADDDE